MRKCPGINVSWSSGSVELRGVRGFEVESRLYFSQNCVELMELKWMWIDDLMK